MMYQKIHDISIDDVLLTSIYSVFECMHAFWSHANTCKGKHVFVLSVLLGYVDTCTPLFVALQKITRRHQKMY